MEKLETLRSFNWWGNKESDGVSTQGSAAQQEEGANYWQTAVWVGLTGTQLSLLRSQAPKAPSGMVLSHDTWKRQCYRQRSDQAAKGGTLGGRTRVGLWNPAGVKLVHTVIVVLVLATTSWSRAHRTTPQEGWVQQYVNTSISKIWDQHLGEHVELQILEATPQTDKIRSAFHWMPTWSRRFELWSLGEEPQKNQPSQARGHP